MQIVINLTLLKMRHTNARGFCLFNFIATVTITIVTTGNRITCNCLLPAATVDVASSRDSRNPKCARYGDPRCGWR